MSLRNLVMRSAQSVPDALGVAAEAARAGAESTRNLTARYGRAKYLGDKTRGHLDPGAASISLMFDGFCSAFHQSKGDSGNA